jgi:hypothetical protein
MNQVLSNVSIKMSANASPLIETWLKSFNGQHTVRSGTALYVQRFH